MTSALEVDATQFVLEVLAPDGLGGRVVTELPGKLADVLPVRQVIRVGGPNDGVILDQPTFAIHAFAASQKEANVLLYATFKTLQAAVGQVVTVDGVRAVMTRVRLIGGPVLAPYENPALRHAVSTIEARIKTA